LASGKNLDSCGIVARIKLFDCWQAAKTKILAKSSLSLKMRIEKEDEERLNICKQVKNIKRLHN
jgi:hypothetical protein